MNTLFIGQCQQRFKELDSTNNYLRQRDQKEKLPEGFAVVAKYQTLGRGQFGNSWQAQAGKNLLLSVLLKPSFLPARHNFILNMSVCLAMHDFFQHYSQQAQIKWPNDILIGTKKLAGVLIENQVVKGQLQSSIIGMGLNLNQEQFTAPMASSLKLIKGTSVDVAVAESRLFEALEKRYLQLRGLSTFEGLRSEYLQKLYGYAHPVLINQNGAERNVVITDVKPDGYLEVLNPDQSSGRYAFKEISFVLK